jgi:hypothetical protein
MRFAVPGVGTTSGPIAPQTPLKQQRRNIATWKHQKSCNVET